MGVKGLTGFVQGLHSVWERQTYEPNKKKQVKLVVDGLALLYHLYFRKQIEWVYGGQYAEFEAACQEYINSLRHAGFQLYVLFDGTGSGSKGKNVDMILDREKERIRSIHRAVVAEDPKASVLPLMAASVFYKVLRDLDVPFMVSDYEADAPAAFLAKHYNCGVLSRDSDFFIVSDEYIPFDQLRIDTNGNVHVQVFSAKRLAKELDIDQALLPLFAACYGNDQIDSAVLLPLHQYVGEKFPQAQSSRRSLFGSVAQFLAQYKSVDEALDAIVKLYETLEKEGAEKKEGGDEASPTPEGPQRSTLIRDALVKATKVYIPHAGEQLIRLSDSMFQIEPKEKADDDGEERGWGSEADSEAGEGELIPPADPVLAKFPDWAIRAFRRGLFNWRLMTVATEHSFWCSNLCEDLNTNSAWLCTDQVRTGMYSIILKNMAGPSSISLTEFIRFEHNFIQNTTEVNAHVEDLPGLHELSVMKLADRRALLLKMLKTSKDVQELPAEEQLGVAALRLLVRSLKPSPTQIAVLICCILRPNRTTSFGFSRERLARLQPAELHLTGQWQVVLCVSEMLNHLLMRPLADLSPSIFYDGHFLYKTFAKSHTWNLVDVITKTVGRGSVPKFWDIYSIVTKGLQDKLPGHGLTLEMLTALPSRARIRPDQGPKALKTDNPFALIDGGDDDTFAAADGSDDEDVPAEPIIPIHEPPVPKDGGKKKEKKKEVVDEDVDALLREFEDMDADKEAQAAKKREKKKAKKKKK
eukprot:TRINITY_DN832_c0_g1_i1.p1 TRINITY_DN832_c0_g1~~TRINITY_DN832_c0_g1_i1.p1  ORF type:complete len:753 (-),score=259.07 TRINITY_DN832_c0_g1_i1:255-2513(-)